MSQRISVAFDGIHDRDLAIQAFHRLSRNRAVGTQTIGTKEVLVGAVPIKVGSYAFDISATLDTESLQLSFDGDYRTQVEDQFQQWYVVSRLQRDSGYQFQEEEMEDGKIRLLALC